MAVEGAGKSEDGEVFLRRMGWGGQGRAAFLFGVVKNRKYGIFKRAPHLSRSPFLLIDILLPQTEGFARGNSRLRESENAIGVRTPSKGRKVLGGRASLCENDVGSRSSISY